MDKKLIVPGGQTIVGALLALEGINAIDWAWGEISLIAAVGFLLTGIMGLLSFKKKDN